MWLDEDAPIRKRDLVLTKPFVNLPGMLGFAPDPHSMPFLEELGAFVTNPLSRNPRKPAKNRACLPFPGGFLLHTGWPNPGIHRAITRYKHRWAGAPLPVIVHLLVESPLELAEMAHMLEGLENILALELGLPPNCSPADLKDLLYAASGEYPVLVSLAPEQVPVLIEKLVMVQPAAIHLTGPRGTLPQENGGLVSGRLYGPSFFPLTLSAARTLVASGLCVIAGCGVFDPGQVQALIDLGITAVSLHSSIWQITSAVLPQ